jgi:integrase
MVSESDDRGFDGRLTTNFIATAPDGRYAEPGDLKGVALEIDIRRKGQSKLAYVRYPGIQFGEPRTVHLPIGTFDDGLANLRRERVAVEDILRSGKSPRRCYADIRDKRRAKLMTLRQAIDEFFENRKKTRRWNDRTKVSREKMRRLHLDPHPIMDLPLEEIRPPHLELLFAPKWNIKVGVATHMRSVLNGTFKFQMNKGDDVFTGPNPATWSRDGKLSQALGEQVPHSPLEGPRPEEIPHLMRYFRERHNLVPEYLCCSEAAYAYECHLKAMSTRVDRGHFNGVIRKQDVDGLPNALRPDTKFIPVTELIRVLGPFKRPPMIFPRTDVFCYDRLVQCMILTPARASNFCADRLTTKDIPELHGKLVGGLRWRQLMPGELGGIIRFQPRRKDPNNPNMELPSEHKLGWKYPINYDVILTDNLAAIFEEQRQMQIRDGVKIEPDGLVFIHGKARAGDSTNAGKHLGHRGAEDHMAQACDYLIKQGLMKLRPRRPTPHGVRKTFPAWASIHGYSHDLVELSLGHILPVIRANSSNWAYYMQAIEAMIPRRRAMMQHWEQDCLSLCKGAASNVVEFPQQAVHKEIDQCQPQPSQNFSQSPSASRKPHG